MNTYTPSRRNFLGKATLAGVTWLTPIAELLAREAEAKKAPAKSVIVLWMQGGPSQLETFDPHPGKSISGGTQSIKTKAKGVEIAQGFQALAEQMNDVSIIRSMVSKEGDHERGTYTIKTGFRPDPTVVQPALGSIICHELEDTKVEIPRHVSILSSQWPARGGFIGDKYDAFRTDDPAGSVPDTKPRVPTQRDEMRLNHLDVLESEFARGRGNRATSTLHQHTVNAARKMMTSEQLKAFDVSNEPMAVRKKYGATPFGRGCLAARRLIEVGVRCVEVTLSGWDTHVNNTKSCTENLTILDPAFAALIADLRERKLLDSTIVLWAGEFGRTPRMNATGGRDHWPTGFSVALAGGGIRGGQVIGSTDPNGVSKDPANPITIGQVHATILKQLGIDYTKVHQTPIGRTVKFADGEPIKELV